MHFLISSGCILSNMMISAPAFAADNISPASDTSTSIFLVKLASALARSTAFSIPIMAIWLSFIITASDRLNLWVSPPPSFTAFFSNLRNPGVVFLVHASLTLPASATHRAVNVAIPLIRHRKLRASLSERNTSPAWPHMLQTTSPDVIVSPSFKSECVSSAK